MQPHSGCMPSEFQSGPEPADRGTEDGPTCCSVEDGVEGLGKNSAHCAEDPLQLLLLRCCVGRRIASAALHTKPCPIKACTRDTHNCAGALVWLLVPHPWPLLPKAVSFKTHKSKFSHRRNCEWAICSTGTAISLRRGLHSGLHRRAADDLPAHVLLPWRPRQRLQTGGRRPGQPLRDLPLAVAGKPDCRAARYLQQPTIAV